MKKALVLVVLTLAVALLVVDAWESIAGASALRSTGLNLDISRLRG